MKSIYPAVLGACLLSNVPAYTSELETITVSATPIAIDDAGSSITVISREEIERRNTTIQSLLRTVPGFSVSQQGSAGSVTQVRVRGAEANQVLVMINGVEANDLSLGSEFDFSQITTSDIERIEIVRGPQSALWGSDALAGVIHIITTPDSADSAVTARVESGSFSTTRATVSASYGTSATGLKFSADYFDTDGTNISRNGSEEDGLESLTIGFTGYHQFTDNLDVRFSLRHSDKTSDFDGVDFFVTGLPTDADNDTRSKYLYSGITVSHMINDFVDHSLSLSRADFDNNTRPTGEEADGLREQLRYQLNLTGDQHQLSVRAERETEDFRQRGSALPWGDPNQDRDTRATSIAAEYRYDRDNLHLSLSARKDNNSDFDDSHSWRATANYQWGETTLFASIGESVKNPTFTERYGFFTNFTGNPDLKPEQSLHYEAGLRRDFMESRLSLAATWFRADLEDEINGFVFDLATFGFTSANIDGKSSREGVELVASFAVTERLNIQANYTWLDATQEDFAGDDVTEVRRPEHTGSLSADYSFEKGSVTMMISRTGTQEDDYFPPYPPFQERVRLSGFTLVELSGQYQLTDRVTLTGRVENALDEDYEQVFGFESPGAAAYVGLRLNF